MFWKQFLTPVQSLNNEKAREFISDNSSDGVTLLDVRQPEEYKAGHIPGAKLIPLPDLSKRLNEIDKEKPAIVYCAIGGRSRIAAQMLAGKGFGNIFNLTGGFKSWTGNAAFGGEEKGLDLFSGKETSEATLIIAYSLEEGLKDFYLSMIKKVKNDKAKRLFQQLSGIEEKHQNRIFEEYLKISGKSITREEFSSTIVVKAVEGGMTTEEYANRYHPDWESVKDIIDIAMSIEAQALDLYMRVAEKIENRESKEQLSRIAGEEREHLSLLGKLMAEIL